MKDGMIGRGRFVGREAWILARILLAAAGGVVLSDLLRRAVVPERGEWVAACDLIYPVGFLVFGAGLGWLLGFRPSGWKSFGKGAAFGLLALVFAAAIDFFLMNVPLFSIPEPNGMDTVGPRVIAGLPFPAKACAVGDSIMGSFAHSAPWNSVFGLGFLMGFGGV